MMQILKKRVRERSAAVDDPPAMPEPESREGPSLVAVSRLREVCTSPHLRSRPSTPEPADGSEVPEADTLEAMADEQRLTRKPVSPTEAGGTGTAPIEQVDPDGDGDIKPVGTSPMERRFPNPDLAASGSGTVAESFCEPTVPGPRKSFIEAITERQKPKSTSSGGKSVADILSRYSDTLSQANTITEAGNTDMTSNDTTISKSRETVTEDILAYLNDDNTTILAEGMVQTGETRTDKNIIVYGTYTGKLQCRALIIGACGSVSGEVDAETIHVEGLISGDISANRATFTSTSMLDGSLACLSMQLEHGARVSSDNIQVFKPEDIQREVEGAEFRRYPKMDVSGSIARRMMKAQHAPK